VAAAAGVFLVASAVIAFNSWPGAGFTDRIDNLFVKDSPPAVAWDKPGTQAVATAAGAGSAAVAGTAAGPTFGTPGVILGGNGAAQRGGTVRLPGGTLVSTGANGPGTVGPANPVAAATQGLPQVSLPQVGNGQAQNTVADTVQQTGSGVSNTVRRTTDSVGNTVGGPVGDTVKQTGNGVGQTVDNVTNTVGGLLRPKQ